MVVKLLTDTGKVVAKVAFAALPLAAPKVIDAVNEERKKRLEQQLNWASAPDVIGAKVADAQDTIKDLGLLSTTTVVEPKIKYKDKQPDTVIRTDHKPGTKVAPGKTSIKLYCITEEIVEESKRLFLEAEALKAEKKATNRNKQTERKERIKNALPLKKKTTSEEEPE